MNAVSCYYSLAKYSQRKNLPYKGSQGTVSRDEFVLEGLFLFDLYFYCSMCPDGVYNFIWPHVDIFKGTQE
jgi:hypothetical protein